MVPISELGSLSVAEFANYCADLWERVQDENDTEMNIEEAANMLFGPEPEITYTRWSA
jgi:hypothetical protein